MTTPPITKAEAIAAYGGDVQKLADALGISRSAVYLWDDDKIPDKRALALRYVLKPRYFARMQKSAVA